MARTEAYRRVRESIDPDDYSRGFALWSGTSFAAPFFAGRVAERLSTRSTRPTTGGGGRGAHLDGGRALTSWTSPPDGYAMMASCPPPSSCTVAPWRECAPDGSRARDRAGAGAADRARRRPARPRSTCHSAYVDAETGAVDAGVRPVRGLVADDLGARDPWPGVGQLALMQRTGRRRSRAGRLLDGHRPARRRAGEQPGPAQPRQPAPAPGDAASAVADLTEAAGEFDEDGLDVQRAKAEHNLGYARLLTGDLVGALQAMDAARRVLAPLSPRPEPSASRTAPRC